ncbi:MAG: hypothetical protein A2020_08315 [Lentisphaerae bacterium GWF2_45_14]|nr:MAG: hypothetical protein A2020_08315 [Lentisphaerae bacterium GWF2_45_14]
MKKENKKKNCYLLSLMITTVVSLSGCTMKSGDDGITIVKDGTPSASIVIDRDACRSARFAAAELQYHIEKITGAKLPIVTDEDKITGNRILVGESKQTRNIGLFNKNFKNQEYLIQFLPDTLVLMGKDKDDKQPTDKDPNAFNLGFGSEALCDYKQPMDYANSATFPGQFDEQATCYAVYDFLERFCGVRWYLPTDVGLVCPQGGTLIVTGTNVRKIPAMRYRLWLGAGSVPATLCDEQGPRLQEREGRLFVHRQRTTGIEAYAINHSFYGYYDLYLKKHPEWFAKGHDKDMPEDMRAKMNGSDRKYREYYPNMCYTNEGFVQHVIDRANDYFTTGHLEMKEKAAGNYFALCPMDSSGKDKFCQCPACQALLHNDSPCDKWRSNPFFWDDKASDYIFGFVNKVARGIAKTHPDKYLTIAAYHQSYYPPTREQLEPNVAVTLCIHAQLRAASNMNLAVIDLMNQWCNESKDRPKYLWLYFHRPGPANPLFPGFMAHNMVKQMEDYQKRGIKGIFAEPAYFSQKGPAMRAPIVNMLEMYLTFKLAYDSTIDGNKLINEFFTLYYGAAAKEMQALYEKIEQVYCSDPANNHAFGYQNQKTAWEKLGTKERMEEFGILMKAAKSAAKTDMEKKRVELFEKSVWNHMQTARAEYENVKAQKKSGIKTDKMD